MLHHCRCECIYENPSKKQKNTERLCISRILRMAHARTQKESCRDLPQISMYCINPATMYKPISHPYHISDFYFLSSAQL